MAAYATGPFGQAAQLLQASARRFGLKSVVYRPDHPVIAGLRRRHPDIMAAPRGAGYWLWKPFVTLDAMASVPEGTPVFYADVAMTVIADPWPLLALAERQPVTLFGSGNAGDQGRWTKRDCFIELDADRAEYWDLPQLTAGMQLYRAGPEAQAFLARLADAMANPVAITDEPNIHGLPNLEGFRDHRHDQSILTILAHREKIPVAPDPSQFGGTGGPTAARPFGQIVHLHRRRDVPWPRFMLRRLRRYYSGGRLLV